MLYSLLAHPVLIERTLRMNTMHYGLRSQNKGNWFCYQLPTKTHYTPTKATAYSTTDINQAHVICGNLNLASDDHTFTVEEMWIDRPDDVLQSETDTSWLTNAQSKSLRDFVDAKRD